ncbi:MAG TPA: amino acid racemase [Pyrinomonadaceae bacterium]
MAKHIGIVSVTDEGTALCYRTICREAPPLMGEYQHPQMTIHTFPLADYVPLMSSLDWEGVAELLLKSAEIVARAGADFVISPCNTAHEAFDFVKDRSPIPWLHIVEVVADAAASHGMSKLGILGTKTLMEGSLYSGILSERRIESMTPHPEQRERVNAFIFDELIHGKFKDSTREYFQSVVDDLAKRGCDAVVLGCTEIPLILEQQHTEIPLLDSTRLLAKAALHKAVREH